MKYYYKIQSYKDYYSVKYELEHLYDKSNRWSPGGSAQTVSEDLNYTWAYMIEEFENEHPETQTLWGKFKTWINT